MVNLVVHLCSHCIVNPFSPDIVMFIVYVHMCVYLCLSFSLFSVSFSLPLFLSVCMYVDVYAQIHTNRCIRHSRVQVFDNHAVTVMIGGEPWTLGIFDTSGIIV